jgi:hypothetical protein
LLIHPGDRADRRRRAVRARAGGGVAVMTLVVFGARSAGST